MEKKNVSNEITEKDQNCQVRIKSYQEFSETGLFTFINSILHAFGWVMVYNPDKDAFFPARTSYRGFSEECVTRMYKRVAEYMVQNAEEIKKEANE